jgi:hypothetical protein
MPLRVTTAGGGTRSRQSWCVGSSWVLSLCWLTGYGKLFSTLTAFVSKTEQIKSNFDKRKLRSIRLGEPCSATGIRSNETPYISINRRAFCQVFVYKATRLSPRQ